MPGCVSSGTSRGWPGSPSPGTVMRLCACVVVLSIGRSLPEERGIHRFVSPDDDRPRGGVSTGRRRGVAATRAFRPDVRVAAASPRPARFDQTSAASPRRGSRAAARRQRAADLVRVVPQHAVEDLAARPRQQREGPLEVRRDDEVHAPEPARARLEDAEVPREVVPVLPAGSGSADLAPDLAQDRHALELRRRVLREDRAYVRVEVLRAW